MTNQKKQTSEAAVREIRRRTRMKFSPEEKIRIVLDASGTSGNEVAGQAGMEEENAFEQENTTDESPRWPVYGKELILDLHECDASKFTREGLESFFEELCELIDMERCDLHFWDDVGVPIEEQQSDPKTKGTSAVQFILTSTIVIHTLDLLKTVYINVFSCKEFDAAEAEKFTAAWFSSGDWTATVVTRR